MGSYTLNLGIVGLRVESGMEHLGAVMAADARRRAPVRRSTSHRRKGEELKVKAKFQALETDLLFDAGGKRIEPTATSLRKGRAEIAKKVAEFESQINPRTGEHKKFKFPSSGDTASEVSYIAGARREKKTGNFNFVADDFLVKGDQQASTGIFQIKAAHKVRPQVAREIARLNGVSFDSGGLTKGGQLKRSIYSKTHRHFGLIRTTVGATAPYAVHVEFGAPAHHSPKQAFLLPAFEPYSHSVARIAASLRNAWR